MIDPEKIPVIERLTKDIDALIKRMQEEEGVSDELMAEMNKKLAELEQAVYTP